MESFGLNLTNIPDNCRQIFNISLFSCREPPAQRVYCGGPWDVALGIIIIGALFALCFLFSVYMGRRERRKALETGEVTYHPMQPTWLRRLNRVVKFSGRIRFECVDYTPEYQNNREKDQGAIQWIQSIHGDVQIPKTARIISVPMANFKTGRSSTEFIPISGMAHGSFLSYQVCGKFSLQVTRYVEDGIAYVAGYCMYIWSPYATSIGFAYEHIKKWNDARPKYQMSDLPGAPPPLGSCYLACEDESEVNGILDSLKLTFCKLLREPVMIRSDNGVISHFKWHGSYFLVSECSSCCLTVLDENPPSYQSLINAE